MIFEDKMKSYQKDLKNIKQMFAPETVCSFGNENNIWDEIVQKIKRKQRESHGLNL